MSDGQLATLLIEQPELVFVDEGIVLVFQFGREKSLLGVGYF